MQIAKKLNTMKATINRHPICYCYLLALATFAPAKELPEDVQILINKRDNAISQINIKFVEELEKLKVKYTKSGDLDSANAIVALIEKTPDNLLNKGPVGQLVKQPAKEDLISLDGKWLYRKGNATDGGTECRISGGYLIRPDGRSKMEQKNGQVIIDFGKGVVHRFDIINEDTLRGKNNYGNTYQYVRVKE